MKTLTKNILPIILLIIAIAFIGSSCGGNDSPKEEKECNHAISYKVNGTLVVHDESAVTAEIWPADNYQVNRKVYDIWTDEAPTFYFHSSASAQGEVSTHVENWQNQVGSTLLLNAIGLESDGLTFTVVQEASAVDDLVKISFSGTTANGKVITDGLICTYIDIVH